MPNRVLFIVGLLLGGLTIQGCAVHPTYQVATPEIVRAGAVLSRTQIAEAATINCPTGTTRREFVEHESRVQSGRGGSPSTIVRVQCIPNGARAEEIPPLARSASPLPVPHHVPYGGHQIPYSRHYDTGYRPPGHYWGGGGHHRPHLSGGICLDWFGNVIAYEACHFRR